MTDTDRYDEITTVIRNGVHDAYRLGLGAAIQVVEIFAANSTDPCSFLACLDELRARSASLTPGGPT